jgi:hypothetical protein
MTDLTAVNASAVTEAATLADTDFLLSAVGGVTRKSSLNAVAAWLQIDSGSAEDALASAASAAASAAAAGAASGRLDVGSFAQLSTKFNYTGLSGRELAAEGDIILWREMGFAYEVLGSGDLTFDFDYTGTGGIKANALPDAQGKYSLLAFGTPTNGTSDSTAFFIKAAGTGGRYITIPAGTFLCYGAAANGKAVAGTFNIPSNTTLEGIPGATIIRPYTKTGRAAWSLEGGEAGSGPTDDLIENVIIRGIKFYGWVETDGHFEQAHLVNISGVKNFLMEDCLIYGPRGDGIYFGSGNSAASATARQNSNITVRKCVFDGLVNGADGGRNAISVINADGVLIDDCDFRGWSKNNMPGAVCLEPNNSVEVIKRVTIQNSRFADCEGNRGHIAISVNNTTHDLVNDITIINNEFGGNNAVSIYTYEVAASFPTTKHNIKILNNQATAVTTLVKKVVGHVHGMTIAGNSVLNGGYIALGNASPASDIRDLKILNNTIICNGAVGIVINNNVTDAVISGNTVGGATQACVIIGTNSGGGTSSDRITIVGNTWLDTPTRSVQHDGNPTPNDNVYMNNIDPNKLASNFRAFRTDYVGSTSNIGLETVAPQDWPYGESASYLSARTIDAVSQSGILKTSRLSSTTITSAYQIFIPNYDATYKDDLFFRKAIDATTWDSWYQVTGV